ncbi:uncharacterized protein LOC132715973 isoform X2 [Ruditapes philippinarum]|uniref:uncharacterized protein LOC132715973 isoform X2 n=1 Tax=Ruditapes philippinarum TaxID=129788 RepID=UPI00295B7300|nr:uncharacterized protein LOC132715973 isoform X2 [Ruditapes philippinarum]
MSSHKVRIITVEPSDGTGSLPPLRADTKKLVEQQIMLTNKRSQVFTHKGPGQTRSRSVPDRTFKGVQFTHARDQSLPRPTEAEYRDDFSDSSDEGLEEQEVKLRNTSKLELEQMAVDISTSLEEKEEKHRESMDVSANKGVYGTDTKIKNEAGNKEKDDIDKKDKVAKAEKENIATTSNESDQGNEKKQKKKKMKLPGCFGFISTWIAKRKEKRREKKRKAIASRTPTPTLVQYEHRKARGGESFTIEVDCKPLVMKPILPPIKKAVGPIRLACEARQEKAEAKRNEELSKKKN